MPFYMYIGMFFNCLVKCIQGPPKKKRGNPSCTERYIVIISGILLDLLYVGLNMLEHAVQEIFLHVVK